MITTLLIVIGLIAGLALLVAIWGLGLFNGLVSLRNKYRNAFAQIDVQLKRRHDLIPNLIETAKGYMAHEKGTLEAVINARNQASAARQSVTANPGDAAAVQNLNQTEAALTGVMTKFMALTEAYPDLKANTLLTQLSSELAATEDRIAYARQGYNSAVTDYNTQREMFPGSILAGAFGFTPAQLFEVTSEADREPVKVQF